MRSSLRRVIGLFRILAGIKRSHITYRGPYKNWEEAVSVSTGYGADCILEKVSGSTIRLLEGHGAYERDGTLFKERPTKYKLRDVLCRVIDKSASIVDYGGGLGGTYLCNRDIFEKHRVSSYCIVEQDGFCDVGTSLARRYNLPVRFSRDTSNISNPTLFIFSSVLHYLDDWDVAIALATDKKPQHIIVDRQPLTSGKSSIYVQHNSGYYSSDVSYPLRIINVSDFLSRFHGYSVIDSWTSDFDEENHKGFLFQRNDAKCQLL